jgi:hypothetical protein
MALVMAPDANTIQSLMHKVLVDWKCCVAHIMRKSLPHRQPLEQLLAAKQRKQQKKLRSEQWRFEMAMDG